MLNRSRLAPFAATLFALTLAGCGSSSKCDEGVSGVGGSSQTGEGCTPEGGAAGAGGGAEGLLVDDFEDGDDRPLIDGGWFQYTDLDNGGASTIAFTGAAAGTIAMNGPGYRSQRSLEVSYAFESGTLTYEPFVGFGVGLAESAAPLDWSAYTGIAYTYRGGAQRVRIETFNVLDYDYYGVNLPASADWASVNLSFAQLTQEGWGTKVPFDPSQVGSLSFQMRGASGTSGQLNIDDLTVVSSPVTREPDLTLQAPQIPAETVLDSIEITNPLQAKASALLNRGYNITNWLEQGRFAGFTYDEAFVEKLARAGFKSLRLPIDLDLYISERTGTGDSLDITLHEDLFTVLDAFADWTQKYGLSFTIDYHQYDKSLLVADADSVAETVLLWGYVAAHFADDPREDLFYELLNEPELSAGGTPPTQAEWTAIAERMVSAIRAADDAHTIIFGDVEWYGIGPLSRRQPLSDPNIIYAFHSYEPFIFTHQGAEWAGMASTHDLPYPYTPERWSEYSADLGFGPFMESWILAQARDYYRTGNRSALWNRAVVAKRWAVEHDVPVICNEFGAYDRSSRLEDRARYYTDLIGVFEELQIPWQHWFMVMDSAGAVIPEYRNALRLDDE